MSEQDDLLVDLDEGVLTITLNRPDRLNTLTMDMHGRLHEMVSHANRDPAVKVLVLAGAGRGFCGGHDLAGFNFNDDLSQKWQNEPLWLEPEQIATRMYEDSQLFAAIYRMNKPTIAAVRGAAAGSGLTLAIACDLRLASESAVFKTAFANAGRCGEPGSTFLLQQLVGPAKARELLLLDEKIDAATAASIGLANKVFSNDTFEEEVRKIARKLASGPAMAYSGIKRNLASAGRFSFEDSIIAEAASNARASMSHDGKEAGLAFMEKRAPNFRGY